MRSYHLVVYFSAQGVQVYCDENFLEPMRPVSKPRPVPIVDDNMTIRVPSMEAFAEMARASSTPFHGRHFIPDEDDNTCNVEIAFKKPEPIPEPVLPVQPNQVNYITTLATTLP